MNDKPRFWILLTMFVFSLLLLYALNSSLASHF